MVRGTRRLLEPVGQPNAPSPSRRKTDKTQLQQQQNRKTGKNMSTNSILETLIVNVIKGEQESYSKRQVAGLIRNAFNEGVDSVKSRLGRPALSEGEARVRLERALSDAGASADSLQLVSWGGTATGKSVFYNAALDRRFERTLVSVLKAVQSGRPLTNLGCGTGNHGNKSRTLRTEKDMRRKENRVSAE